MLAGVSVWRLARVWEKLKEEEKDWAWLPVSKLAVAVKDEEGKALES
jgi:hypothetical protein